MTPERRNEHFDDELQLLLDGRFEPAQRVQVEAHLSGCERCRTALTVLEQVQRACRGRLSSFTAPAHLESELRAAIEREDRRSAGARAWLRTPHPKLVLALAALALVAVVSLLTYSLRRSPRLPHAAVESFTAYQAGELPLDLKSRDGQRLERFFTKRGITFPTRVFDLAMMRYVLEGGRVHQIAGRSSALFVYRGPDGRALLCQMYPGRVAELPAGAVRSEDHGIVFHQYRIGGSTAIFWQEGAVTCVLVSDADPEEVLQLAIAKAVKI